MIGREIIIIDGDQRYIGVVKEADQRLGYTVVKKSDHNVVVSSVSAEVPDWDCKWKTFVNDVEIGQFKRS